MKKYLFAVLLLCNSFALLGQTEVVKDSAAINTDSVYADVDVKAEYPGGHKAWSGFIEKKVNGLVAVENGAPNGTYTVIIACVIDESGKIIGTAPQTNHGYGMEKEALRVLGKLPKPFTPAYKNGIAVKSILKFPITFGVSSGNPVRL